MRFAFWPLTQEWHFHRRLELVGVLNQHIRKLHLGAPRFRLGLREMEPLAVFAGIDSELHSPLRQAFAGDQLGVGLPIISQFALALAMATADHLVVSDLALLAQE